ncbi:MAG TPA: glycosyltransferase family 39 protein [Sedimentisphaerales bacterium]|nr:glycosyltransferase family 39 protein [Sedimentisphaerales bacterium]
MAVGEDSKRLVEKQDLLNLSILLSLALGIGVYLIATTVLIAKDGVFYIERAQEFASNPLRIIKGHPFGYPFLIFLAHKLVAFFGNSSSVSAWIYSAQSVSLIFRVLSFIPLYFIGKTLVGSKKTFWALLVLVFLPHPAKYGSDTLRDWPHLLFLAAGFFLLLWGAKNAKWWSFGLAGLAAGLGYMIRPECAQLVVYGILWLLICLVRPRPTMSRPALTSALCVLLIGFAVPVVPYMKATGRVLPRKLKALISSDYQTPSRTKPQQKWQDAGHSCQEAGMAANTAQGMWRLIQQISEDLMHFFMPALLIGIYSCFRRKSGLLTEETFFIAAFVILNVIMLVLLYSSYGYISRRHCLPLVAFIIFYVPVGLQILAVWLSHTLSRRSGKSSPPETADSPLFYVLLVTGLLICLPKLVRPIGFDKKGYRDAADWLRKYSTEADIVIVPDTRVSFYAQRKGYLDANRVLKRAAYALIITENENEPLNLARAAQKVYSVTVDKRKKKGRKIVVYKML